MASSTLVNLLSSSMSEAPLGLFLILGFSPESDLAFSCVGAGACCGVATGAGTGSAAGSEASK